MAKIIKHTQENVYIDNTMVSDYKECPRYYYLRHIRGWRRAGPMPPPLAFGLAWHEAMDVIWTGYGKRSNKNLIIAAMKNWEKSWVENGHPSIKAWSLEHEEKYGARTPMNAMSMLEAYIQAREPILAKCKLHAAEQPFAVPIFPDMPHIWYIGRLDKHIEINGDQVGIEHKTTSEYKRDGGFRNDYIEGWSPNSQVEGYLHQSQHNPHPLRYIWIDAALVHKTARAFKFIPVGASMAGLDAWLWEVRDWVQRIEQEKARVAGQVQANTHLTAFPRNTGKCAGKYGLCSFINICRSIPNPHKEKEPPADFVEERWEPFDILGLDRIIKEK